MSDNCPMCGSKTILNIYKKQKMGRDWHLARCSSCLQHFTNPIPTLDEISGFYENNYHANLRTDSGTEENYKAKYKRYVETLNRHLSTGKIVDVGCSTGLLVNMLKERGYKAEGIELNSESADWGRQNYGIVIHNKLLENCSYEAESLDAILFTDVLEHTQHPCNYLQMAGERLVDGGLALITFPDIKSIESRYGYLMSKLLRRKWVWGNCYIPLHVWEFTPVTAKACFIKAGFEVIEFRRSQPPLEPTDSLILKIINIPIRLLSWPIFGRLFGSQMEFVIRKSATRKQ